MGSKLPLTSAHKKAVSKLKSSPVSISADELWAEVERVRESCFQPRPKNSFTAAEYAEKYGIGITTARTQLNEMAKLGKMKAVTFIGNGAKCTAYCVARAESGPKSKSVSGSGSVSASEIEIE